MAKNLVIPLQIILFLAACGYSQAQSNQSETLTISTYYPSPYGVYRNLEVKRGLAVGDITKSGNVNLDQMAELQTGQIYVNDSVVLNALNADPGSAVSKAGQVIYNGPDKMLRFFDGNDWINATPCSGGRICLPGNYDPPNNCTTPGYTCQKNATCRTVYYYAATSAFTYSCVTYKLDCRYQGTSVSLPAIWTDSATPPCVVPNNCCPTNHPDYTPMPSACYGGPSGTAQVCN